MDAGKRKHFAWGLLAGRISVELAQTAVELDRVQWGALQVVDAAQCGELTATHCRRINEQTDVTDGGAN